VRIDQLAMFQISSSEAPGGYLKHLSACAILASFHPHFRAFSRIVCSPKLLTALCVPKT
jgi:hypothetical protein